MKTSPHLPQLERAREQQQRPSAAKLKNVLLKKKKKKTVLADELGMQKLGGVGGTPGKQMQSTSRREESTALTEVASSRPQCGPGQNDR